MPQSFQFKITLLPGHIEPPIWRKIIIDSEKTLFDLHYVIQGAMGWTGSHLYAYYHADEKGDINRTRNGYADLRLMEGEPGYHDDKFFRIKDIFKNIDDMMFYEYDFGDGWEHIIRLEAITETSQKTVSMCIDGERNCPIEDCGGLYGYLSLVEAVKNPRSKQAREMREWIGEPYNPEKFDLQVANHNIEFVRKMTESNIVQSTFFGGNSGNLGLDISDFLDSLIFGNQDFFRQINRLSLSGQVLVLKITVQGLKPEVSRTIEVEPKLKFRDLMKLIRASFGWISAETDMGYYFILGGDKFGKTSLFKGWYSQVAQKKIPAVLYDDSTIKLSDVFTEEGIAVNCYMPLNAWKFRIKCTSIKIKEKNKDYPTCVAGKGNLTQVPQIFDTLELYINSLSAGKGIISANADLEAINGYLRNIKKKK